MMIPKMIKSQENRFELANPGLFVVLRNIPKIKINTDNASPNIDFIYFLISPIPQSPRGDSPFCL